MTRTIAAAQSYEQLRALLARLRLLVPSESRDALWLEVVARALDASQGDEDAGDVVVEILLKVNPPRPRVCVRCKPRRRWTPREPGRPAMCPGGHRNWDKPRGSVRRGRPPGLTPKP